MALAYPTRTLREMARVIFSRLLGIVLVLAVVVGSVVVATYLSPWQYRSRALLMVRPAKISALESTETIRDRLSLFIVTQRQLIESDRVVASALLKLAGVEPAGPEAVEGKLSYSDAQIAEFVSTNAQRMSDARRRVTVQTPGGPDAAFTQTFQLLASWPEERNLARRRKMDSKTFAVQRAREYAENLLEAYELRRSRLELERSRRRQLDVLNEATAAARAALDSAGAALEKFISEQLKGDLVAVESMLVGVTETGSQSLWTKFNAEIRELDARKEEIDSVVQQVQSQLADFKAGKSDQVVVPEAVLKANPPLVRILDSIVTLQLRLNNLSPRFQREYKEIKEIEAELQQNRAYLRDELARQAAMLQQERAALAARRAKLDEFVKSDRQEVTRLAAKVAKYKRLKDDLDNAQTIHNRRVEEAVSAQNVEKMAKLPIEVVVLDKPSWPDVSRPHRPILWVNVLVAIIAGLILALVYAFLADHFDHSVKGIDDVARHIEVPVLASIPRFRRRIIRRIRGAT